MRYKPVFVGDMSGSVGALTASHNRGGDYFRLKGNGVNPNSPAQAAIRAVFGLLASSWADLTQLQRDGWKTYAENVPITGPGGDPLILTGQQMWIRSNTQRLQGGLLRVDDAPISFTLATLAPLTIAPSAATGILNITYDDVVDKWSLLDGGGLLVYVSRQQSPTINFFKGPYRFAGIVLGNTLLPPPSPDVTVVSPFAMDVGNVIFTRFVATTSVGQLSPTQFLGKTLIAA